MNQFIIYWALVLAPSDLGRVEAIFQTYEPCHKQAEHYKSIGYTAECIPTNQPEIIKAENQLKNLAVLISKDSK